MTRFDSCHLICSDCLEINCTVHYRERRMRTLLSGEGAESWMKIQQSSNGDALPGELPLEPPSPQHCTLIAQLLQPRGCCCCTAQLQVSGKLFSTSLSGRYIQAGASCLLSSVLLSTPLLNGCIHFLNCVPASQRQD